MARKTKKAQAQPAAPRTYHSTPAAPQQVHFPARRTTIVKTYSSRRSASARTLRQQTLTQIDYVKQAETSNESALEPSPSKPERPQKRRKTMGDAPSSSFHTQTLTQFLSNKGDKDQEDDLLQIKDSDGEDDDDVWEIPDYEEELPTLPKPRGSSGKRKQPTRDVEQAEPKGKKKGKGKAALFAPHVPSTPSSKRIKVNLDEVPSSQPTPFTPALEDVTPLYLKRLGPPGEDRSPLKERSTNIAPTPTLEDVSKRPRNLVIQDSYSTGSSARFSSSLAGSSPNKKADETPKNAPRREPLAELPVGSFDLGEDAGNQSEQETPTRPRTGSAKRVYHEIPDSDEELESVGPSPMTNKSIQSQHYKLNSEQESQEIVSVGDGEVNISAPSSPPGVVNVPRTPHKVQSTAGRTRSQVSQRRTPATPVIYEDPSAPAPNTPVIFEDPDAGDQIVMESPAPPFQVLGAAPDAIALSDPPRPKTPVLDEDSASTASESEDAGPGPGTPTPIARKVQIQLPPSSAAEEDEIFLETPRRISPRKPSPKKHTLAASHRHTQGKSQHQGKSQLYSQGLESQRVPLEVIRNMGPITDRSDILISIHPEPLKEIVAGTKDHEFRSYKLPEETTRLWIYTTRPVGEVRYMARIGPPRKQGEPNSQSGLGNAEFNNGEMGANMHAYELIQVYELNNPVPQAEMKEHGMGDKAPQRYRIVPPAIVGQLLGNLKRALFAEGNELDEDEEEEDDLDGGPDLTVSQELEEQIRSDIIGSTQVVPAHEEVEVIPASQEDPPPPPRTVEKMKAAVAIPKVAETPKTSRRAGFVGDLPRKDDEIFARPALPRAAPPPAPAPAPTGGSRFSSRIRSQRSQQQQQQQQYQLPRVPTNFNGLRPSQATTASQVSSPGVSPSKLHSSSSLSSVPRPSTSDGPDVLRQLDDDYDGGDSSPLRVGTVSQLNRMVMQDSLMVDEVRPPPMPVILDSDDEGEEDEDAFLPTR
ncbi:hypothetical protein QBC37DRAFT_429828 [Rhypophila decipiens]|uniref:Uncharacterized protein n=1 Tax=Rhypophila decipiens TaxID=261697 RepID=A0AAN6XZG2_9PEZI|nr:hypothetical protein QBC37DRAFT_429828 [Rhypophila decipiens]